MASVVNIQLKSRRAGHVAYHIIVLEGWEKVLGHPLLKKIVQADPLEIENGGLQAPFNQKDFVKAIKAGASTLAV